MKNVDILNYLHSISINLTLDNVVITIVLAMLVGFIAFIAYKVVNFLVCRRFKIVNMNINIANIGNVSIETNKNIENVAHKAWIEIMTRKVGLLFEEDKDVIVEVYNSWYALFGIIRDLLKDIEPRKKDKDMEILEDILVKTLNYGLRPHLTRWQAKYRRWYEKEIKDDKNKNLSPQEIQKNYDKYDELVLDLKQTNKQMVQFAEELKKLF